MTCRVPGNYASDNIVGRQYVVLFHFLEGAIIMTMRKGAYTEKVFVLGVDGLDPRYSKKCCCVLC